MRLTKHILGTMAMLAFGLGAQAAAIRYTVTSLGNIPGTPSAINASGQVVGTFARDDRNTFGSFLYSNGQFIDMTDSGANGRGINDAGQMTHGLDEVGINNTGQTIRLTYNATSFNSYLVDGTTQIPLPFEARAINDSGQVGGNVMVYPGQFAAALFKDGELTLITPPMDNPPR